MHTDKKILIVDDDASIRKVLRFALEKAEFSVIEAENGEVALALFSEADFIVLDVMMHAQNGRHKNLCENTGNVYHSDSLFELPG